MLGFYPQESFIAAFFTPNRGGGFSLGPLARVDITNEDCFEPLFDGAKRRPAGTIVFVYAVTGALRTQQVVLQLQALLNAAAAHNVAVEAAWSTREIRSGEPYHLVYGPRADELAPTTTGIACWESGIVAPPCASIAFRHLAATGDLPELDRDSAYEFFDGELCDTTSPWVPRVQEAGMRQGTALVTAILAGESNSRRTFDVAMTSFIGLLRRLERQRLSVEALARDEEAMEYAAAYWSHNLLRDSTLVALDGPHAKTMSDLALAAARTFHGVIRANALCIFALSILSGEVWVRALPAVRVALEEAPGHRFAELLHEAVLGGLGQVALQSSLRASHEIAERYGEASSEAA